MAISPRIIQIQQPGPTGASGFSGYSGKSGSPGPPGGTSGYSGFSGIGGGGNYAVINVKDYGAKGDAVSFTDGAITSGTNVFHSGQWTFAAGDIGKEIVISGALSASPTAPLYSTVTGVSAGNALLADNAGATVGAATTHLGTNDIAAFKSAVAAMTNTWFEALPYDTAGGYVYLMGPRPSGVIYIPKGMYYIGRASGANVFNFPGGGTFKLFGDGMGLSTILYSGDWSSGAFASRGCGISVGDGSLLTGYVVMEDFTIRDVSANPLVGGGNGIAIWYVSKIHINRVEVINAKGNASINLAGFLITATPFLHDAKITNCIIRSDPGSTSDHQTGDGINIGDYINVNVSNNRIYGAFRQGYEGGGTCLNQVFIGNDIDMLGAGNAGINPTGGTRNVVMGNNIRNVSPDQFGIDFTCDLGAGHVSTDTRIIGNYVDGLGRAGVRVQNTSGDTSANHCDRILISNNQLTSTRAGSSAIYLDGGGAHGAMDVMISDNRLQSQSNALTVIGFQNPTSNQYLIVRGNHSNTSLLETIGIDQTTARHYIFEDNMIDADSPGSNVRLGGYDSAFALSGSVGAGAITSVSRTYSGAIPGRDTVIVVPATSTNANLMLWGTVTAADTVEIRCYNPTGSPITLTNDPLYYLKRATQIP